MAQSLEKTIDDLEKKILPQNMADLTNRHGHISRLIQYLEGAYISADQSLEDRSVVENRAKGYLVDALFAVVNDISATAGSVERFIDLQMSAMDSLTTNVNLVQTRLDMCKEQHAMDRLAEMRTPITASPSAPARKLEGDEAPPIAVAREPFTRQSLEERISKYEEVGVSFSHMREEGARRGSTLRRESYSSQNMSSFRK